MLYNTKEKKKSKEVLSLNRIIILVLDPDSCRHLIGNYFKKQQQKIIKHVTFQKEHEMYPYIHTFFGPKNVHISSMLIRTSDIICGVQYKMKMQISLFKNQAFQDGR